MLAVLAAGLYSAPRTALDWQPGLVIAEPWRALTAAGVHYSARHLALNLAGAAVLAAMGALARPTMRFVWAWAAAWPLTHWGLVLRPDLRHYGGLSGVLHAAVAVMAVHLLAEGSRPQRLLGAALLLGLVLKVASETPWGAALRHPPGWDIAIAPFAHATGLAAGLGCGMVAALWPSRPVRGLHG